MKRGQQCVVSLIFLASVVVLLSTSFVSAGLTDIFIIKDFFKKFFGIEKDVVKGPDSNYLASYTFKLTNDKGKELPKNNVGHYQIKRGKDFFVNVYVNDLRSSQQRKGIFAAYASVVTQDNLITFVSNSLVIAPSFSPTKGSIITNTEGSYIDKAGGVHKDAFVSSSASQLLFRVKARAVTKGVESIAFVPADYFPLHSKTLLKGKNEALTDDEIGYSIVEVAIV